MIHESRYFKANAERPLIVFELLSRLNTIVESDRLVAYLLPLRVVFSAVCVESPSETVRIGLMITCAVASWIRGSSHDPSGVQTSFPKCPSGFFKWRTAGGTELVCIPEPELVAIQSELDSVVGLESLDLSGVSISQAIPHFDLTKAKYPSKPFSAPNPKPQTQGESDIES